MRLLAYLYIYPSPISNEITFFRRDNKPAFITRIHSNVLNFPSQTLGRCLKPLRLIEEYCIGVFNPIIDMFLIKEGADPIQIFSQHERQVDPYSSVLLQDGQLDEVSLQNVLVEIGQSLDLFVEEGKVQVFTDVALGDQSKLVVGLSCVVLDVIQTQLLQAIQFCFLLSINPDYFGELRCQILPHDEAGQEKNQANLCYC